LLFSAFVYTELMLNWVFFFYIEGGNWFGDTATPNDAASDQKLIDEAVKTAKMSDTVILERIKIAYTAEKSDY